MTEGGGSGVDVLVATPGRLVAHLAGTPGFSLAALRFLVVDETDRLLRQAYQDWLPAVLAAAGGGITVGGSERLWPPTRGLFATPRRCGIAAVRSEPGSCRCSGRERRAVPDHEGVAQEGDEDRAVGDTDPGSVEAGAARAALPAVHRHALGGKVNMTAHCRHRSALANVRPCNEPGYICEPLKPGGASRACPQVPAAEGAGGVQSPVPVAAQAAVPGGARLRAGAYGPHHRIRRIRGDGSQVCPPVPDRPPKRPCSGCCLFCQWSGLSQVVSA